MASGHVAGLRDLGVTPIGLLPLLQRIHERLDHAQPCSAADLVGALAAVRSSDELIRTTVERSCILDSGAVRIVLPSGAAGKSLCLQLWSTNLAQEASRGNIHNDCFDFSACVMAGELLFEEFEPHPGGRRARRYAHISSSSLAYTLESAAEEAIRRRELGVRRSGCTYQMQAETLHRTWGREGRTTALLLSQGRRRRSFPDVYLFGADAPRLKAAHRAMTPPALLRAFDEVVAAL